MVPRRTCPLHPAREVVVGCYGPGWSKAAESALVAALSARVQGDTAAPKWPKRCFAAQRAVKYEGSSSR